MKFTMFIDDETGRKIAVNRDSVRVIEDHGDGKTAIWFDEDRDGLMYIVREDFATVHSRLNIIEGD